MTDTAQLAIELDLATDAQLRTLANSLGVAPDALAASAVAGFVGRFGFSAPDIVWILRESGPEPYPVAEAAKLLRRPKRRHGGMKGQIHMSADFDDTPPEVEAAIMRDVEPT